MNAKQQMSRFAALSSALTGFVPVDLEGTGMLPVFWDLLETQAGEANAEALVTAFDVDVAGMSEAELTAAIRARIMSDPRLGPLARNLIKLWYFGIWYQMPSAWRLDYAADLDDRTFVVSDIAYKNALVWRAMLAHPKGARQPGFGSWTFPPGQP